MKKVIGLMMVLSPFLLIFSMIASRDGFLFASSVFGLSILTAALIIIGVNFLTE